MATHDSTINTTPAGVQLGGVSHPPYTPDLVPGDFHLLLHLKKFLFGQNQRFQTDREAELSVTVVPIPGGRLLQHMIQKLVPRYDKCLNSGGEYVEKYLNIFCTARRVGSDGSMSASGSAGPGFNPRRGGKF